MDMATVYDELARRNEEQIRNFVPIRSDDAATHRRLLWNFEYPSNKHRKVAEELRNDAIQHRDSFNGFLTANRKKVRDAAALAKQKGEDLELVQWADITEAEPRLFTGEDAPYKKWFLKEIVTDNEGKSRPIGCASEQSLFEAVWDNLPFRRFMRVIGVVTFGYPQKVWADEQLNMQFATGKNDDTDFSLLLYARDGDVILTEDRIRHAISHADVENRISVQSWKSWMETKLQESSGKE